MAKIVTVPNGDLRKGSKKVGNVDGSIRKLVKTMKASLKESRALGVAAPQIGVQLRVIVVDLSLDGSGRDIIVLINPEIVSAEGEVEMDEACLSVPDQSYRVTRCEKVTVRGMDESGRQTQITADGLLARVFQHEIDHLDGRLIIDVGTLVGDESS